MATEPSPGWLSGLEPEEIAFIKNFILASGSLKEIAQQYDVSYPTVRLRLNRLIEKIKLAGDFNHDPYISLIKTLAISEKIDTETAKRLIAAYQATKE